MHVHKSKYKGVYESPQIHLTRHYTDAHRSNFKRNIWMTTHPNLRDMWEGLIDPNLRDIFECPQILNKGLRE